MIDIGRVGLWTSLLDQYPTSRVREVVAELEALGWPCIWRPETSGRDALVAAAHMLDATTTLRVATGIAQIQARHPLTANAAQRTLHEASGGRFLLGLGVSHAPMITTARKLPYVTPYSDMAAYLAAMKEAPFSAFGAPDDPTTEIEKIVACADIPAEFPDDALEQARQTPREVEERDLVAARMAFVARALAFCGT